MGPLIIQLVTEITYNITVTHNLKIKVSEFTKTMRFLHCFMMVFWPEISPLIVARVVFDRNGIFAETPKYISVKIGFPAEIIRFWPKLFGFRC